MLLLLDGDDEETGTLLLLLLLLLLDSESESEESESESESESEEGDSGGRLQVLRGQGQHLGQVPQHLTHAVGEACGWRAGSLAAPMGALQNT